MNPVFLLQNVTKQCVFSLKSISLLKELGIVLEYMKKKGNGAGRVSKLATINTVARGSLHTTELLPEASIEDFNLGPNIILSAQIKENKS